MKYKRKREKSFLIRMSEEEREIANMLAIYRAVRRRERTESFNGLIINILTEAWYKEKRMLQRANRDFDKKNEQTALNNDDDYDINDEKYRKDEIDEIEEAIQ